MPRRGFNFEAQIKKVADYINSVGGHAHKNNADRTVDGVYLKGECFDWEMFLPNYKCVFDSKECKADTWHIVKKDIIQAEHLKHCKNCGFNAYFLICFDGYDVRQVDVDAIIEVLKQGKKSIKKDGFPSWELIKILNN